ncbi:hypothetical protein [Sporisorium scitamineum]|uniref:Uncharacterized protein n=1 Tax=Sporisorium scitamineum TaxID=49012 RepID=A0A0F7S0Z8_9BASI|nr:hypothetical protein [Sporisorium scitamineum]
MLIPVEDDADATFACCPLIQHWLVRKQIQDDRRWHTLKKTTGQLDVRGEASVNLDDRTGITSQCIEESKELVGATCIEGDHDLPPPE